MRRGYVAECSNSRWVITVFWCFGGLEMEWGADLRTLQARDDRRKEDGSGPCVSTPTPEDPATVSFTLCHARNRSLPSLLCSDFITELGWLDRQNIRVYFVT